MSAEDRSIATASTIFTVSFSYSVSGGAPINVSPQGGLLGGGGDLTNLLVKFPYPDVKSTVSNFHRGFDQ